MSGNDPTSQKANPSLNLNSDSHAETHSDLHSPLSATLQSSNSRGIRRDDSEENCFKFPAGTILAREGESSRKMYVIKKGKVRIFRKYLGQHVTLAVLGDGEIFGEMSFFDGEPRSASVEALTELSAIVIDGAKGHKQIADLPTWVHTIFRTVAARFRQLDKQVTMLQSVYEFQKKTFNTDNCAKTIYTEILRFLKTIALLCEHRRLENVPIVSEQIVSEAEGLLGNRYLSFRVFWGLLKEHEIVIAPTSQTKTTDVVLLQDNSLLVFEKYIESMISQEQFLILSHNSLAILRRIAGKIAEQDLHNKTSQSLPVSVLRLSEIYGSEEALAELDNHDIVLEKEGSLHFIPEQIVGLFIWQSIIKSFDYTTVKLE